MGKKNAKGLTIRKSNDLIQKSRFDLSLQQQKIILYLISQIQPTDTEFHEYVFSVKEFCETCGIDSDNGNNYIEIKEQIKTIADKSLWVSLDDGRETLLRWIEKATIEKGNVKIRLDNDMRPFLLQLKRNYTIYELVWTLNFKSKYSIRLYELIKSIHYSELQPYTRKYSLEELRTLLGAETYPVFADFRLRALEPAIKEINETSDKYISYNAIKTGRKVSHIEITVSSVVSVAERLERYGKIMNG